MKIYTKKGDSGTTGLIGGTRLPKHHIRIESYGTVDELNSYLGLLRDCITDGLVTEFIVAVQDRLFTIGSQLAVGKDAVSMKLPNIHLSDIETIESKIDEMDATLPAMTHFVLPGGHQTVSHCHIARCICRRAERNIAHLAENEPVAEVILAYMNRLSDYLFVLSRKLVLDLGVTETLWIPKND